MKKKILSLAVIMMAVVAVSCGQQADEAQVSAPANGDFYYATFAEAKVAAEASGKSMVLDFYTDWWSWCKKFDTVVLIDSSMVEYFSNEMIFVKVHAEKADSLTAKQYKVSGFPTFVVTDSKGVEIDRIVGYLEAEDFLAKVNDYQNGIGTLDDLLAKVEASKDRATYFEIADKYKYRGAPDEAKTWFEKVVADGEPTDSLSGEARFSLADMMRRNKEYDTSIAAFRTIKSDFKGTHFDETASIYIPYVTMKKGDTANAIMEFQNFIKQFPESEDVEYATTKISELKGEAKESK